MRDSLQGRHLLLGVTGGIAAYKACDLVRRLLEAGASVQVVMTEAACRFVGPATFQALSGRPVYTDIWDASIPHGMAHIALSREADGILVAPASLDFMARLASAQTPDLLSLLCSARDCPLYLAPAMNRQMWEQPASQAVVGQLRDQGIALWGPGTGAQACGEEGDGRMLEPLDLLDRLAHAWSGLSPADELPLRGLLSGRRVVVTAGPTFEPIDPVRGITNRSSGKMGYAIATAAAEAGAQVVLVSGPTALRPPLGLPRIDVITANDMMTAVQSALTDSRTTDLFIGVAAVADWRPESSASAKMKKGDRSGLDQIAWVENPDILAWVGGLPPSRRPYTVGFAAETMAESALRESLPGKRARKSADLLIGNDVRQTLGRDSAQLYLQTEAGLEVWAPLDKPRAARDLMRWLARRLPPAHQEHQGQ